MLNYLRKTISLNNLHCHKPQGQIATLLMLFMVGAILFILVTVNMGKVSITSTLLANAADTAALQLASVFATESHSWWISFGQNDELKQCKTGGLLGVIAAIVLIAVAIIGVCTGHPELFVLGTEGAGAILGSLIILGAVAGSLTMGIGTLIMFGDFSGFARGAIDGARTGAIIGGGMIVGAQIGWVLGAFIGMILAAGGTIYTYAQQYAAINEAIAKSLEKIPNRYIRLRESIFYTALSPIVTDTERVSDVNDIDKDGDTEEKVSAFQDWFYARVQRLKRGGSIPIIQQFVDTLNSLVLDEHRANSVKDFMLQLSREEVECDCNTCPGVLCGEGPLIEMFRRLRNNPEGGRGYRNIPFWTPGPNRAQLLTWYNCSTEPCLAPYAQGFDTIDFVHKEYEELIDTAEGIVTKSIAALNNSYDWVDLFYNRFATDATRCQGTNATSFYCRLIAIRDGKIETPRLYPMLPSSPASPATTISAIRNGLRECQLAYSSHVPRGLVDSRDNPSCGEPYNPAPLNDPAANPFYPCIWFLGEELSNPVLGANLPNYPCKITPAGKSNMRDQITTINRVVAGLPDSILNDSQNTNDFALPTTPCTAPFVLVADSKRVTIDVTNISLLGDKRDPYSDRVALDSSWLYYDFDYNVSWRCVDTAPDPDVYTNPHFGGHKKLSEFLPGVNSVVEIIEANSNTPGSGTVIDKFRDFLSQMRSSVQAINTAGWNTGTFASLDVDLDDEFKPVMQTLNTHPFTVQQLIDAMKKLGDDIKALGTSADPPNGAGSVIYRWPDRQTGPYAASAETGPFLFPKYEQTKSGGWLLNKTCQKVSYYCDNMSAYCIRDRNLPFGRTWVRVGREEPANVAIRSSVFNLGFWNPFRGFNKINITRTSYPYYNYHIVGIARRSH